MKSTECYIYFSLLKKKKKKNEKDYGIVKTNSKGDKLKRKGVDSEEVLIRLGSHFSLFLLLSGSLLENKRLASDTLIQIMDIIAHSFKVRSGIV